MTKKYNYTTKTGRPTVYTKELGDMICTEISMGKSLAKISKEFKERGVEFSLVSVFAWLRTHNEFLNNYTKAKEEQAELYAEQIIDIADEELPKLADGKIDSAMVKHKYLKVDARKWVASKLKPKKYGDRIQTEDLTSKEPVELNINLSKDEKTRAA